MPKLESIWLNCQFRAICGLNRWVCAVGPVCPVAPLRCWRSAPLALCAAGPLRSWPSIQQVLCPKSMQFGLTRRRGAPSRGAFEGMHGFRDALDTLQAWLCRGRGDRANSVSSKPGSQPNPFAAHTGTARTGTAHPDTRHQTPDTGHQTPDTGHQTPDTRHRAHRIAIRGHSSGSNDRISFIAHGSVGALLLTDLVGAPMDRSTDQPGLGFFCVRRQALGSPARLEATRLVRLRRDTEFPASGWCDTSTAGQGQRHIWPAATTRIPLAPSSESVASSAKASRTRPVTASRGSTW